MFKMMVERTFKGRDYALGKWLSQLIITSTGELIMTESFELDGNVEITLKYDNTQVKKLIKKAYKEMQKGNI